MSRYIKSDYIGANNSFNSLESLERSLNDYSKKLNSCLGEAKNKISSSSFEIMFSRLQMYVDAFKYLSDTITQISENTRGANYSTSSSMKKYSKLTDQELEELKRILDMAWSKVPSENDFLNSVKYKLGNKKILFEDYSRSINEAINIANINYNDYKEALDSTKQSDKSGNAKLGNYNTKLNVIMDAFSKE